MLGYLKVNPFLIGGAGDGMTLFSACAPVLFILSTFLFESFSSPTGGFPLLLSSYLCFCVSFSMISCFFSTFYGFSEGSVLTIF